MMTGADTARSRSVCSVASPSGPGGIIRSRKMASGSAASTASTAALPLAASVTSKPSARSSAPSIRRMLASSSTRRMERHRAKDRQAGTGSGHLEGGPASGRVGDPHLAPVVFDGLADQRQAESGALVSCVVTVGLEHRSRLSAGTPGPWSAIGDHHAARARRDPDLDRPCAAHRLDGVAQQVAEGAAERVVVAQHARGAGMHLERWTGRRGARRSAAGPPAVPAGPPRPPAPRAAGRIR